MHDHHNHHPVVRTPEGTPAPDRTVGELVAERPGRSRVFQSHGIDFCCQGGRTLREACERKSIALETVLDELEAEEAGPEESLPNPALLEPAELCRHIVGTHHEYLRRELPRLHAMAQRVAHVHGGHTPSLVSVFETFAVLADELTSHMLKEEQVLFPLIEGMAAGASTGFPVDGPIAMMMHEHEDAGAAIAQLRELTNGYNPPPEACNTYRALFAGLEDLEKDMHAHVHLENSVLFPAAAAMAGAN